MSTPISNYHGQIRGPNPTPIGTKEPNHGGARGAKAHHRIGPLRLAGWKAQRQPKHDEDRGADRLEHTQGGRKQSRSALIAFRNNHFVKGSWGIY